MDTEAVLFDPSGSLASQDTMAVLFTIPDEFGFTTMIIVALSPFDREPILQVTTPVEKEQRPLVVDDQT